MTSPTMAMSGPDTTAAPRPDVAEAYARDGFWVEPAAFTAAEVAALRDEAVAIACGERGPIAGAEPRAPHEDGDDVMRRTLCLHFPHKVSRLVARTLAHPRLVELLTSVIGPDVKSMQSMLFIKAAGKPGQAWHQDEDFIPTRDRSLTGAWIALDDATVENGCLWVIPGSHRSGVLWPQEVQDDRSFDCTAVSVGFPYGDDDAVPVEVAAGSVVLFNGYTLHRSLPNVASSGYRRALVNHYMSASSLLPWHPPAPGTAVAVADCRDVVLVAGRDPYAYKGSEDLHRPHVRPSGEGGCGDPAANL